MTDTPKRPLVTSTGLITAAIALTLPFIADRLILSVMQDAKEAGIGPVIGMAVYTALPFLLLDSAMRPRRRVRLALWMGLALTVLVWAAFAQTGVAAQVFEGLAINLKETCSTLNLKPLSEFNRTTDIDTKIGKQCLSYYNTGNAHVGLYMLSMIWPALIIGIMGAAAKIGEPNHDA